MNSEWTTWAVILTLIAVTLLVLMAGCVNSNIKQGNPNCVLFCETDVITENKGAPSSVSKTETKTAPGGSKK